MNYLHHIVPRRIILALVCLAGLGLRIWGLDWGDGQPGLSQEWTAAIVDQLRLASPTFSGVWTQTFYSLAALLKGGFDWVWSGLTLILAHSRTATEAGLSPLLAGRLLSALMGWFCIPLTYVVGRRYFDSVGTGLLAASLIAVCPLLVAYSHYLTLDTPLCFMVLLCLLFCWYAANDPKPATFWWCGLLLGLTITTRASGVLILPAVVWAYFQAVRQTHPDRLHWRVIWPLVLLFGVLSGLLLGYPGFVFAPLRSFGVLGGSFPGLLQPAQGWLGFLGSRFGQAWDLFAPELGLEFLVLWPLGVVLLIIKRRWSRLPLVLVCLLFMLAGLLGLKGSLAGLTVVWMPPAAMLAAWPLVLVCRRLPGDIWPTALAVLFGIMLCAWPLWRSLGVAYIFWQEDTRAAAVAWAMGHMPPKANLWLEPGLAISGLDKDRLRSRYGSGGENPDADSYGLLSYGGPDRGEEFSGLDQWQPLAVFDLKRGLGRLYPSEEGWFPPGVSPGLQAQVKLPQRDIIQPLALVRPPWRADKAHSLIYSGSAVYSKCQGFIKLDKKQTRHRVLREMRPLQTLGLRIANLGRDLATIRIDQGPWPSQRVTLYPGQVRDLLLPPREWPPMVHGIYPVSLSLKQGDNVMAQLAWDPLILGRRALENNRLEEAAEILDRHTRAGGQGFEAYAMLAEAQARLGSFEEAGDTLRLLEILHPKAAHAYYALGRAPLIDRAWQDRFEKFTGYYLELLHQASSQEFEIAPPPWLSRSVSQELQGEGYQAEWVVDSDNPYGLLDLKLTDPLAAGAMTVSMDLVSQTLKSKDTPLARVELWARKGGSSRLLHHSEIKSDALKSRILHINMPVNIPSPGAFMVLKLKFLSPGRMWLSNFKMRTDLRAHLRHMLRWYFDASGRVAHKSGKFPQAVEAFESLLVLDPGFRPAYLPITQALMDSGKLDSAYSWARQAERMFQSQPEALGRLRALYQQMQRKKDVTRVDEQLAHLRPSLKRQAEFSGGMELMGYDLPKAKLKPGQDLAVSYYWRTKFTPLLDYFVYVHLRGPDGKQYVFDHRIARGRVPMTDLKTGQVVREDFRHPLPLDAPKGRYRLVVGLWDPKYTGKAMPIIEGDGKGSEEVLLAEIEIQ